MKCVIGCKCCMKMRLYSYPALYRLQGTQHRRTGIKAYRGTRLFSTAGTEGTWHRVTTREEIFQKSVSVISTWNIHHGFSLAAFTLKPLWKRSTLLHFNILSKRALIIQTIQFKIIYLSANFMFLDTFGCW